MLRTGLVSAFQQMCVTSYEEKIGANGIMQAYVIDSNVAERLVQREMTEPTPLPHEMLVRGASTSLNRGEIRMALENGFYSDGYVPGWDATGNVEQAAANGQGPHICDRIVGFVRKGAWAQKAAVPAEYAAVVPNDVSFT